MSEVLDFPPIEAPPLVEKTKPTPVAVVEPQAGQLSIEAFDLTKLALAYYGPWESDVAAVKAKLDGLVLDVSTQTKVDEGRSLVHRLVAKPIAAARKTETALKAKLNGTKTDVVAQGAKIVSAYEEAGKGASKQLDEGQAALDEAKRLKAEAEAARVAAHKAGIAKIGAYLARCQEPGMTAERIGKGIALLEAVTFGPEWEEFAGQALKTQDETLAAMRALHTLTAEREAAAAQAEADRIEREAEQARIAAENERKAAELAEQQRALAAQAAELAAREKAANDEQERIATLKKRVADIHAMTHDIENVPSWDLFEVIVLTENIDVSEAAFQEFAPMAADAKRIVLAALLQAKDATQVREAAATAQAAEVERSNRIGRIGARIAPAVESDSTSAQCDDTDPIRPDEPPEFVYSAAQEPFGDSAASVMAAAVDSVALLADCQEALREALQMVQELVNGMDQATTTAGNARRLLARVAKLRALGGI